jgi:hypothetical protein
VGVDAVGEAVAFSGAAVPALRTALAHEPTTGVERALLALLIGADYSDALLREELIQAYEDAVSLCCELTESPHDGSFSRVRIFAGEVPPYGPSAASIM